MTSGRPLMVLTMVFFVGIASSAQGEHTTVTCGSSNGGRHYCDADTRGGVELARQRSSAACKAGYSWGFDTQGIWVDHDCRADFSVGSERAGGRTKPPCTMENSEGLDSDGNWSGPNCTPSGSKHTEIQTNSTTTTITTRIDHVHDPFFLCSSGNGARHYCAVGEDEGIRLIRQLSGTSCREGFSWGMDEHGVWVDHGCSADFGVTDANFRVSNACSETMGGKQARHMEEQCLEVSPGTHSPCNSHNSCKLLTDEIRRGCRLAGSDAPTFCEAYRLRQ